MASHHARQREGHRVRASAGDPWPSPPEGGESHGASQPSPREGLTSAWPPGVSVLLQRSHLRQNLCQSLPRELTFSARGGRGGQDQRLRDPAVPGSLAPPPPNVGCELEPVILSRVPAQAR